jgi:hypothetical protein
LGSTFRAKLFEASQIVLGVRAEPFVGVIEVNDVEPDRMPLSHPSEMVLTTKACRN